MGYLDVRRPLQVGHRPGYPEDAVIAAGGEAQLFIGPTHQMLAALVQPAVPLQLRRAHVGVAGGAVRAEAGGLDRAGRIHPLFDVR